MLTPPIEPMLAQARDTLPRPGEVTDPFWQQKADGYRCLAFIRAGKVYLQSRRGADLTDAFRSSLRLRPVPARIWSSTASWWCSTTAVWTLRNCSSGARQRGRGAAGAAAAVPAHLIVFDLLEAPGGEVLLSRPYRQRWTRLEALVSASSWGVRPGRTSRRSRTDSPVSAGCRSGISWLTVYWVRCPLRFLLR